MQNKLDNEKRPNELLDELDRMILNEIQSNLPIEPRPYQVLAEKLQCSEEEVLRRVQDMKDREVIRRIGANCNSRKLGYTSTLCAAKVPSKLMQGFVEVVNSYTGVTHNYRRAHEYNIWFTLIAPSKGEIRRILTEIAERTGVEEIMSLPAERLFKIQVDFEV
ncbi:MAG: AsnC family transcriptional regulator [Deltaproteobacteria bacterium]|nr:AsnC family transcriptional regulator [Deltaproteobacteria bacterium]